MLARRLSGIRRTSIPRLWAQLQYLSTTVTTPQSSQDISPPAISKSEYDVIVVGGGHNGLTSAAYLARAGLDVLVLERRHLLGGAAVTEELYPGFKYSRASYLAGLLRPQIIKDLELESHGFKYLSRDPSSFTPTLPDNTETHGRYLLLGDDAAANRESIAQFSVKDSQVFDEYLSFLHRIRELVTPILDCPPPLSEGQWRERVHAVRTGVEMVKLGSKHKGTLVPFYEILTAPASHLLDRWFESDILKTTLATDAVIGAMVSPHQAGSAYVLLHHVMGEADGKQGTWAYVEGGMGKISGAIASAASKAGAELVTNAPVSKIIWQSSDAKGNDSNHSKSTTNDVTATGVQLADGRVVFARKAVVAGCSPYHAFGELMGGLNPNSELRTLIAGGSNGSLKNGVDQEKSSSGTNEEYGTLGAFLDHVEQVDMACGAFKINCAIDKLPNFTCLPNTSDEPAPHHRTTIHFESRLEEIEDAYREASQGIPATRPVIEMTIPSSLDTTISPKGQHVAQLFIQYAPYDVDPSVGNWADPEFKNAFADRVFAIVDEYAPGFSKSVLHRDVLSPLDLEQVFGLPRGNIFHGALALHQLGYARPAPGFSGHRSPVKGLYMGSAGAHPGGGVMGAPGRNCARVLLSDQGVTLK